MKADPFSIRVFVPDGDPEGVRLIDRLNWTGLGLVFRRSDWSEVRKRSEMQSTVPCWYIILPPLTPS